MQKSRSHFYIAWLRESYLLDKVYPVPPPFRMASPSSIVISGVVFKAFTAPPAEAAMGTRETEHSAGENYAKAGEVGEGLFSSSLGDALSGVSWIRGLYPASSQPWLRRYCSRLMSSGCTPLRASMSAS